MHFANAVTLAVVLFTTLIENLRRYSSAEAGIVLSRALINFWSLGEKPPAAGGKRVRGKPQCLEIFHPDGSISKRGANCT